MHILPLECSPLGQVVRQHCPAEASPAEMPHGCHLLLWLCHSGCSCIPVAFQARWQQSPLGALELVLPPRLFHLDWHFFASRVARLHSQLHTHGAVVAHTSGRGSSLECCLVLCCKPFLSCHLPVLPRQHGKVAADPTVAPTMGWYPTILNRAQKPLVAATQRAAGCQEGKAALARRHQDPAVLVSL